MADWITNSLVYEINAWIWLHEWSLQAGRRLTLAEVPEAAWEEFSRLGVGAVWLMGIWERSPAGVAIALRNQTLLSESRERLPDLRAVDVVGSPYCVRRYEADPFFGGPAALAVARSALARRGIRLLLDFVPNHVAPDHPWVAAHPDWLLRGSRSDLRQNPGAFCRAGAHVFALGRDPYFPPWSDVLQLNAFDLDQRRGMIGELRRIAEQCDGVRCDMAMLVLNEVFARTWGNRAGTAPAQDYWPEVIGAVKPAHPDFCFIAEAYWNRESKLLEQGFDASYDKGLYDQLAHGTAGAVRDHVVHYAAVQDRLVRFVENHDEPRAAQVFPWAKGRAAAIVMLTLPGIRLLHQGQLEGRKVRAPIHLGRRPKEPDDSGLRECYTQLLRWLGRRPGTAEWLLCETDNPHLLAWCWRNGLDRCLVVVNYSEEHARGQVRIPWPDLQKKLWRHLEFERNTADDGGDEVAGTGLAIDLEPWDCRLWRVLEARDQP